MAPAVQRYFEAGLAPATHRSYMAGTRRFQQFCTRYNIDTPFPVTEHRLCCFAAYLADDGLAPQSIKSYLSAVRNLQLSLGLPDPREQSTLPLLRRVQAGIARCRVRKGTPRQVRLPITSHILARISERLRATSHPEQVVVRAVAFSAFFGFFRLGELLPVTQAAYNPATSLSWGDVAVDSHASPRMIQFHLRQSKCDQAGVGADVVVGVTGSDLCPVTAVLEFVRQRGSHPGQFFVDSTGKPITKPWLVTTVRAILQDLGFPPSSYAGHSFRIGAATTAAMAGLEDSMVQTLGRWQSAAFRQYIRTPKDRLAAVSVMLASQPRSPNQ